jgi:hypothetical protein
MATKKERTKARAKAARKANRGILSSIAVGGSKARGSGRTGTGGGGG